MAKIKSIIGGRPTYSDFETPTPGVTSAGDNNLTAELVADSVGSEYMCASLTSKNQLKTGSHGRVSIINMVTGEELDYFMFSVKGLNYINTVQVFLEPVAAAGGLVTKATNRGGDNYMHYKVDYNVLPKCQVLFDVSGGGFSYEANLGVTTTLDGFQSPAGGKEYTLSGNGGGVIGASFIAEA